MKATVRRLLAAAAFVALTGPALAQSGAKVPESLVTAARGGASQRVIVLMAPNRQESAREPESYIASTLGANAEAVSRIGDAPFVVAEVSREGLGTLARDQNVQRVVPDRLMQAFLPQSTAMLHVPDAWAAAGEKGDGVSIAVLDTGVETEHPFLAGRIAAEACFSSNSPATGAKSLCPNGQDQQIGPGAGHSCDIRAVTPNCVHGTHVAGIAAGANGQSDQGPLNGVAPAAKIVAVQVFSRFDGEKVCGKGQKSCISAFTSDVLKGLLYVEKIRAEAKVAAVNLSLGGGKATEACDLQSAYAQVIDRLTASGLPVVAASGNNGFSDAVTEPACIRSAVTVGSVDKDGKIAVKYSNASPLVDLVAPGSQILSSAAHAYYKLDGTSMAAPHVAGLFALMKAKAPEASVDQLVKILASTGTRVTDPRGGRAFVMPNAAAAVAALGGAGGEKPGPTPTPDPGKSEGPKPDPRLAGCGPVCVELGKENRRVIFVLAGRDRVPPETLTSLRTMFGERAKVEDIGDGKLVVELPAGTSADDVDRARRNVGGDTRVLPDRPMETLQPGGRIQIR